MMKLIPPKWLGESYPEVVIWRFIYRIWNIGIFIPLIAFMGIAMLIENITSFIVNGLLALDKKIEDKCNYDSDYVRFPRHLTEEQIKKWYEAHNNQINQ